MHTSGNTQLLIIDPQNDFCDIAGAALPVPGAHADMQRLAGLIARLGPALAGIHVSLDSHHPLDIAHPGWWCDAAGKAPTPFSVIGVAEVRGGIWRARDPARQAASLAYVEALAGRGRYQLIIWPEHCLIGSWGHNVQDDLQRSLHDWSLARLRNVNYVGKGSNPGTEHYSAIAAEVPDPADAATLPNLDLLERLAAADTILVGGEALSHCVAGTVRDIADQLGADQVGKLMLLADCCSPVAGFEAQAAAFVGELQARGMRLGLSTDYQA
ncbi:hypothetical protein FNU76_03115 [Chitinimonas arctica]|uniref:Isochorismatase family protein n=1 Tax=Chitinimonas arctica TaxID=2594795 RepID=A0A516SBA7_9NEIS|nr:hypothetical protein [Chitinimonas arctica]QDQ25425.1 hypothetical protein FNU76_03115 [Chitinimonas arctica]